RNGGGLSRITPHEPRHWRALARLAPSPPTRREGNSQLHIEPEMQDIAVFHHILLAFETEFARITCARFALELNVIVIGDGFRANESLLEIRMDDAGGLWRTRALHHGPGTRLHWSGGEKSDETKKRIARTDHLVQAGLGKSE